MRPLLELGSPTDSLLCRGTGLSQTPQTPSCPGAFACTVPSACTIFVPVCPSPANSPLRPQHTHQLPGQPPLARHLPIWCKLPPHPPAVNKLPSTCTSPCNSDHPVVLQYLRVSLAGLGAQAGGHHIGLPVSPVLAQDRTQIYVLNKLINEQKRSGIS